MTFRLLLANAALLAFSAGVSGCFSSSKVNSSNERSAGQQLTDLDQAHRQGIINDKEYARLRKAIIKKYD
jgi:hypothetical protein